MKKSGIKENIFCICRKNVTIFSPLLWQYLTLWFFNPHFFDQHNLIIFICQTVWRIPQTAHKFQLIFSTEVEYQINNSCHAENEGKKNKLKTFQISHQSIFTLKTTYWWQEVINITSNEASPLATSESNSDLLLFIYFFELFLKLLLILNCT